MLKEIDILEALSFMESDLTRVDYKESYIEKKPVTKNLSAVFYCNKNNICSDFLMFFYEHKKIPIALNMNFFDADDDYFLSNKYGLAASTMSNELKDISRRVLSKILDSFLSSNEKDYLLPKEYLQENFFSSNILEKLRNENITADDFFSKILLLKIKNAIIQQVSDECTIIDTKFVLVKYIDPQKMIGSLADHIYNNIESVPYAKKFVYDMGAFAKTLYLSKKELELDPQIELISKILYDDVPEDEVFTVIVDEGEFSCVKRSYSPMGFGFELYNQNIYPSRFLVNEMNTKFIPFSSINMLKQNDKTIWERP